jgi:hypothetical protein
MLCLGVRQAYGGPYQDVLNYTRALGGLAILCHPNWIREDLWAPDAMGSLRDYAGIEIYNHVITRLQGRAIATDDWDTMLTRGRLIWGYANQDAHRPEDFGHAWNMVLATALSAESILHSLAAGRCYGSTGVTFTSIGLRDGAVQVAVAGSALIRFVGPGGAILKEQKGTSGAYAPNGEAYVRVEAQNEAGQWAWSQPFWGLSD